MAKEEDEAAPAVDAENNGDAAAAPSAKPKLWRLTKYLTALSGNRKLLSIAGGGVLAFLLVLGSAIYFFFFTGSAQNMQMADGMHEALPVTPPNVIFYDVPDIIVNIQSTDTTPTYLKLSVALELDSPEEKIGIVALQPRIVDQFQGYLRELRMDDLKGSAGVVRLKEELLRRINAAAAPYRVRDVLLKQMIVQ